MYKNGNILRHCLQTLYNFMLFCILVHNNGIKKNKKNKKKKKLVHVSGSSARSYCGAIYNHDNNSLCAVTKAVFNI